MSAVMRDHKEPDYIKTMKHSALKAAPVSCALYHRTFETFETFLK